MTSTQPDGRASSADSLGAGSFRALLESSAAAELAHSLVARVAEDHGIRVLLIKGPVLAALGLREPRLSADVDVLVDPARVADLLAALMELGWAPRVVPTGAYILGLHSDTFIHPEWPCDLDIHHCFPGMFADAQVAFDALWARKVHVTLAGRLVPCADLLGSALIAALHSLRDPELPRSRSELDYLKVALALRLDEAGLAELAWLASEVGAAVTAAPLLRSLGAPELPDAVVTTEELPLWDVRVASSGLKTIAWLVELRRTPLRLWPGRLWHALVLTETEIRQAQPDAAPGARGLLVARVRRLAWGVKDLPRAVAVLVRAELDRRKGERR
jgi:hypothetical protein